MQLKTMSSRLWKTCSNKEIGDAQALRLQADHVSVLQAREPVGHLLRRRGGRFGDAPGFRDQERRHGL